MVLVVSGMLVTRASSVPSEVEASAGSPERRQKRKSEDVGATYGEAVSTPVQDNRLGVLKDFGQDLNGIGYREVLNMAAVPSTPPDQTLFFGVLGPTPSTPLAAHPCTQTVPAHSTSSPPSPSPILPRNLDAALLTVAGECCAEVPNLPLEQQPATYLQELLGPKAEIDAREEVGHDKERGYEFLLEPVHTHEAAVALSGLNQDCADRNSLPNSSTGSSVVGVFADASGKDAEPQTPMVAAVAVPAIGELTKTPVLQARGCPDAHEGLVQQSWASPLPASSRNPPNSRPAKGTPAVMAATPDRSATAALDPLAARTVPRPTNDSVNSVDADAVPLKRLIHQRIESRFAALPAAAAEVSGSCLGGGDAAIEAAIAATVPEMPVSFDSASAAAPVGGFGDVSLADKPGTAGQDKEEAEQAGPNPVDYLVYTPSVTLRAVAKDGKNETDGGSVGDAGKTLRRHSVRLMGDTDVEGLGLLDASLHVSARGQAETRDRWARPAAAMHESVTTIPDAGDPPALATTPASLLTPTSGAVSRGPLSTGSGRSGGAQRRLFTGGPAAAAPSTLSPAGKGPAASAGRGRAPASPSALGAKASPQAKHATGTPVPASLGGASVSTGGGAGSVPRYAAPTAASAARVGPVGMAGSHGKGGAAALVEAQGPGRLRPSKSLAATSGSIGVVGPSLRSSRIFGAGQGR